MRRSNSFSLEDGAWIAGTPYRVVRPLGRGGMGEVYEVDHTRTGTRRAIKVLGTKADPRGVLAGRLRIEGDSMRAIDHPNVVRVYEVAKLQDGRPYFAMQKLDGSNLRERMRREGTPGVEASVRLAIQALEGLAAAHARKIVHRDVKPSNLFLTDDGGLKVLDFGIARRLDRSRCDMLTEPGVVMGTLRYMAPEQLRGDGADARTDVYAVGLVLWELIAGCHPFDAATERTSSVMTRLDKPAPRLSACVETPLPGRLEQTLVRALAIEPRDRFPSAAAFAAALRVDRAQTEGLRRSEPRSVTFRRASLVYAAQASRGDARERANSSAPLATAPHGVGALQVAFAAHAVGVVLSACAVVVAMIAALAATRNTGARVEPKRSVSTLEQVCGASPAASSRGVIGGSAQDR